MDFDPLGPSFGTDHPLDPSALGFVIAFGLGVFFSPYTWGFIILILLITLWEVALSGYHGTYATERLLIPFGYLFGYLAGSVACRDEDPTPIGK